MQGLKQKHHLCIAALVAGQSIEATAREINVNPSSIYMWLKDPVFSSELEQRRAGIRSEIHNVTLAVAHEALQKIINTMRDTTASKRVQLDAAALLLDRVDRSEVTDLARRLEAIECPSPLTPSSDE